MRSMVTTLTSTPDPTSTLSPSPTPTPTLTPTPTPTPAPSSGPVLGALPPWALTVAVIAVVLIIGILLVINGWPKKSDTAASSADRSVVRSWIAVSLVAGLLVITAAEIAGNNSTTSSALIGGLTASVGSAVAYYFSTKASERAQDKLAHAEGQPGAPILIPDLRGKSVHDALVALGSHQLRLVVDPASVIAGAQGPIVKQVPPPGPATPKDGTVTVTLGPVVPEPVPVPQPQAPTGG